MQVSAIPGRAFPGLPPFEQWLVCSILLSTLLQCPTSASILPSPSLSPMLALVRFVTIHCDLFTCDSSPERRAIRGSYLPLLGLVGLMRCTEAEGRRGRSQRAIQRQSVGDKRCGRSWQPCTHGARYYSQTFDALALARCRACTRELTSQGCRSEPEGSRGCRPDAHIPHGSYHLWSRAWNTSCTPPSPPTQPTTLYIQTLLGPEHNLSISS